MLLEGLGGAAGGAGGSVATAIVLAFAGASALLNQQIYQ